MNGAVDPSCASCQQLRRRNAVLRRKVLHLEAQARQQQAECAALRQQVRDLQEQKRTHAANSSLPPSANPPSAPRPTIKKPTGRKPGAQAGHPGTARRLLPVEQMDQVVQHRPAVCAHCQAPLPAEGPAVLAGRHQVAELPARAVRLIEHQSYACRCGHCGQLTRGRIPEELRASTVGERLSGFIGLLGAWVKGSRRAVAQVLQEALGCPIALGSISVREAELSQALQSPYAELTARLSESKVKYVDETGWKLKGRHRWLWVGATGREALFRVEKTRTEPALRRLLGGQLHGVFCTDRAGIYDRLPLGRRQVCWAHLKRDFTACRERAGPSAAVGQAALEVCGALFAAWRQFQRRTLTRRQLQQRIEPLRKRLRRVLEAGATCGVNKTVGLCRALLKRQAALWRFAGVPGLEPSNNLAERMLRPAVIWRKKSFGNHSEGGCRYVERMLSVIQTLRLRGRDVLGYLSQAVAAYRRGEPSPRLLAAA
jgi:transposase